MNECREISLKLSGPGQVIGAKLKAFFARVSCISGAGGPQEEGG